jgi:hypothetical protein
LKLSKNKKYLSKNNFLIFIKNMNEIQSILNDFSMLFSKKINGILKTFQKGSEILNLFITNDTLIFGVFFFFYIYFRIKILFIKLLIFVI